MSELELKVKLTGHVGVKSALLAVLDTVERHPVPDKRDDPTGEIASAVEAFGDAIENTIRDHLGADHDA